MLVTSLKNKCFTLNTQMGYSNIIVISGYDKLSFSLIIMSIIEASSNSSLAYDIELRAQALYGFNSGIINAYLLYLMIIKYKNRIC